jgi:hypothetical protein
MATDVKPLKTGDAANVMLNCSGQNAGLPFGRPPAARDATRRSLGAVEELLLPAIRSPPQASSDLSIRHHLGTTTARTVGFRSLSGARADAPPRVRLVLTVLGVWRGRYAIRCRSHEGRLEPECPYHPSRRRASLRGPYLTMRSRRSERTSISANESSPLGSTGAAVCTVGCRNGL